MRTLLAFALVGATGLGNVAQAQYLAAPYGYANPYVRPPVYGYDRDGWRHEDARREHFEHERFEHRRFDRHEEREEHGDFDRR